MVHSMRFSVVLLLIMVLSNKFDYRECLNTTKRYFITIDISYRSNCVIDVRSSLELIQNTLCTTRPPNEPVKSVTCFLKFKIVGEPRVIAVVDVLNSSELERRLRLLLGSSSFHYQTQPVVEYDKFASRVLGVNSTLAALKGNTLEYIPEALWCEFNINFGDKNASEILSIWKREAEMVLQTRNSGIPVEIFKTVGERTVHLLTELDATVFDKILFGTPFNEEIPNTLKTTCRTIVNFANILHP